MVTSSHGRGGHGGALRDASGRRTRCWRHCHTTSRPKDSASRTIATTIATLMATPGSTSATAA